MRSRSLLSVLLVPAIAACASGGSGGGDTMALAYSVPASGTVTYEVSDETVITVDAGGQILEIPATSSGTIDVAFAPGAMGGVELTAVWSAFEASMSNPMGAPERATVEDIEGDLVFTLDARGVAEVISAPELSGAAENLFTAQTFAYTMFPRLPGTPPTPGMTWTDTITYVVDQAGTFSDAGSVYTYTVSAEDVGVDRVRIDYSGSSTLEQDGVQMGMAFTQNLQGSSEGHVIWNLRTRTMEEHHSSATMDGVMDMDQMPMPLPLSVSTTQSIVMAGGM